MVRLFIGLWCMIFIFPAYGVECSPDAICSHGRAMWDEPKYEPDFTHFDYTNPDAPKGGDVTYAAIGTFDSLNGHILKGIPAAGINMIYDSLLADGGDEPFTKYGLLAHTIELAKDNSWVIYHLRPEARWHDGVPITAEDVVWSFNTLIKDGSPQWRSYYREVEKVEALDAHQVKFTFTVTTNRELPLILGQFSILPKHYYETHNFTETTLKPPLGSGPYKIAALDAGKWVKYQRVADYWAKDLPVNMGRYNFDTITYDYYRDATVAVEAFKAREYDLRNENISKTWATAYDFPAIQQGHVIKEELEHERPTGMQGFVINTRRDKFKDRALREALLYTLDFEWTNKTLFYGAYNRTTSYFSNSGLASSGLPTGKELKMLDQYRDQLPERIFTEPYHIPITDGSGNNRKQLLAAKKVLEDAGWQVNDGKLLDPKTNQPLELEFLLVSPSFERVVAPMLKNMKKLGITATMRTVDSAQYIKRLEEFDFDITVHSFGQSHSPGNEQEDYWHSSRVNVPGSRNLAGVNDPVVDALVAKIITAQDKETMIAATHALDRVLLYGFYVIPNWHIRNFRLIYWNRFSRPAIREKYFPGFNNWWIDKEKDVALSR